MCLFVVLKCTQCLFSTHLTFERYLSLYTTLFTTTQLLVHCTIHIEGPVWPRTCLWLQQHLLGMARSKTA